jgi:hypothetical protein
MTVTFGISHVQDFRGCVVGPVVADDDLIGRPGLGEIRLELLA